MGILNFLVIIVMAALVLYPGKYFKKDSFFTRKFSITRLHKKSTFDLNDPLLRLRKGMNMKSSSKVPKDVENQTNAQNVSKKKLLSDIDENERDSFFNE